jgi:hypothetical protein
VTRSEPISRWEAILAFNNDNPIRGPEELRFAAKDRGRQLIRRRRTAMTVAVALVVTTGMGVGAVVVAFGPRSSVPLVTPSHRHGRPPGPVPRPSVNATAFAGHGQLAFVSDDALYVLDGTTMALRRVTSGSPLPSSPAFPHDGKWLAFVRSSSGSTSGGETLWIAHGDGSDAHRVAQVPPAYPPPNSGAPAFSWSPTSDELLVTTGPVAGDPQVPRQIWIVAASGGAHRLLGPGYATGAVWSPGGDDVAVLWSPQSLDSQVLETLPLAGGAPTIWLPADDTTTYYLAGWSSRFGILVWDDQGNGGPSVENYGLALGALSQPHAEVTVLVTGPLFEPPALAIGPQGELALVANGNESGGNGEGEKFVWFGKTVETCPAVSENCTAVVGGSSTVTLDPAISSVDGSLAFIEAPQSTEGLPPEYSATETWSQIAGWYTAHTLWIVPGGAGTATEVHGADGASDPVWSSRDHALVYVADGALWLVANTNARPVEVASPLSSSSRLPSGTYLFGYADWSDQFAWTG